MNYTDWCVTATVNYLQILTNYLLKSSALSSKHVMSMMIVLVLTVHQLIIQSSGITLRIYNLDQVVWWDCVLVF